MGFSLVKKIQPTNFGVVKAALLNLYEPSTDFVVVKMYLLNVYKSSTNSVVVKMCTIILHRHSTGLTAVKTCSTIHYTHSTGFAVVKMGLRNLYGPSTGNAASQNWLAETPQSLHRHCSSRNRHNNPVHALTSFVVVRTSLWDIYKTSTSSAVEKTGLSNF